MSLCACEGKEVLGKGGEILLATAVNTTRGSFLPGSFGFGLVVVLSLMLSLTVCCILYKFAPQVHKFVHRSVFVLTYRSRTESRLPRKKKSFLIIFCHDFSFLISKCC